MSSVPRVAIVTGAAQGIGLAIALKLAEDGLDIAINDLPAKSMAINKVVEEIKANGRRAIAIPADVSSEADVKQMIDTTVSQLGKLDVMVANAGVSILKPIVDLTMEEHDNIMSVNSRGLMMCFKYAATQMVRQGHGGRLIGASSVCGKRGFGFASSYCMSKFSIRALIQCMAQELRQHNILVNGYAPGCIDTEMIRTNWSGAGQPFAKELITIENSPLGQPDDVASLVSYLVKPESAFILGQTISVDGGVLFD